MDRNKKLSERAQASVAHAFRGYKQRYALTRLQWLLALAQQTPGAGAQATTEDARRLSERLAIFAGFDHRTFKPLSPQQIARLLADVLKGIRTISSGKRWDLTERLTRRVQPGRRIIQTHLFYGGEDLGAAVRWNAQEMAAEQIKRIAQCTAPKCERLFIRRKAATFCSAKCAGRARFARYYAGHKHELSRLRRKRYGERVKLEDKPQATAAESNAGEEKAGAAGKFPSPGRGFASRPGRHE